MKFGSISTGTHLPQDLAAALINLAESTALLKSQFPAEILYELREIESAENPDEVIYEAIDAFQEFCPPYVYVGFHPGDGSDLGVWPDIEAIEIAASCGEIQKVSDVSEIDYCKLGELVAIVNDHGNVTLAKITIDTEEIWSVV